MRRFIEEIKVQDPMIAEKIVKALETKSEDKHEPVFEIDMYAHPMYDPNISRKDDRYGECIAIKIFIREDLESTDKPVGF